VLGVQSSDTECEVAGAAAPVPDSAITMGEFVALLVTVMLPVAFPAVAGSNVALKVAVCPLDRIAPAAWLLALNPAPATTTFEIVTLEFPALVRVTLSVLLLETSTLPNAKLVELLFRSSVLELPELSEFPELPDPPGFPELLELPELPELTELTVKMAAPLVTLPTKFLTTTLN
jgi:hypothetical protein